LIAHEGISQVNLVPNPSFEIVNQCPSSNNNTTDCMDWLNFGNTPDYYNTCAILSTLVPPNLNVGYQHPKTGEGMMGIVNYVWEQAPGYPNYREYIGCQLTEVLNIGTKYYVSFWVNHSGYLPGWQKIGTNKTGIRFFTNSYSENNPPPLDNFAHIFTDSICVDTLNWFKISGSFVADQSYQYISIGNFFDSDNTDTLIWGGQPFGGSGSYYFVDDICVSTDSLFTENWLANSNNSPKNSVKVYPNPANDFLIVNSKSFLKSVQLFDSFGKMVFSKQNQEIDSEFFVDLSCLQSGIYLVVIKSDNEIINTQKLVIQNSK
jgi:hypothetical protein